jgi:mannose-6-phosphate isomerase-like protein (cupin superfamily)
MEVSKISDYKGGWYIGQFSPAVLQTKEFEIGYKKHLKGEYWAPHYHLQADEYNFLISGYMVIQGKELKTGEVFVIRRGEIANPTFLEDCEVITVKVPSRPGDKYEV